MITLSDPGLLRGQAYINGAWVDADSGLKFPVLNPADGSLLGHVADCGSEETKRAIDAAHAAWPIWRDKTAKERAAILRKWFELIMAAQEDLAATDDPGAGQAAGRGPWRDRLRRLLHRMVRRRRQARLWRHHPDRGSTAASWC